MCQKFKSDCNESKSIHNIEGIELDWLHMNAEGTYSNWSYELVSLYTIKQDCKVSCNGDLEFRIYVH